ncbi:hypothetical protein [Burkholderia lata]|uniref:hypothetical protein n=1 Tax=Burkholderia lata (strain ATCC 17760 / DSM 23089 / LMG 22485 / NCIMB 9086 / R18194 / 383) TaxID=482957 RepID=UPI00158264FC|nr:hypothetical protein [Burkholderia lata]
MALIDGIECRTTGNRRGHPAFATEAIEPSLPTTTRAGQRCGCGHDGPMRLK